MDNNSVTKKYKLGKQTINKIIRQIQTETDDICHHIIYNTLETEETNTLGRKP